MPRIRTGNAQRFTLVAAALLAVAAVCGRAQSQPQGADTAAARALFNEALADMKAGRWDEACPKLERGMLLDHGTGMRHNLALCYEHTKRPASAWALFNEVALDAKDQGQSQRAQVARSHAEALVPVLSYVIVNVPSESLVPGLVIKRDGRQLEPAAWGVKSAVDPGTHVVEAIAPGRRAWRHDVVVDREGASFSVTVPLLSPNDQPAPPAAAPAPVRHDMPTAHKLALVSAGVGVVGFAFGSYFGLGAISKNNESNDQGCTGDVCTHDAAETRRDARASGNISTVGFVVGAVGAAGAIALWIYGRPGKAPSASLSAGPATFLLRGAF